MSGPDHWAIAERVAGSNVVGRQEAPELVDFFLICWELIVRQTSMCYTLDIESFADLGDVLR